ncbi:MAG: hypothetical protein MHM6MM_000104 [Cercozoa sp. M6MM]
MSQPPSMSPAFARHASAASTTSRSVLASDWRANISVEERLQQRLQLRSILSRRAMSVEELTEVCAAVLEEVFFASAPTAASYVDEVQSLDQRLLRKRQQLRVVHAAYDRQRQQHQQQHHKQQQQQVEETLPENAPPLLTAQTTASGEPPRKRPRLALEQQNLAVAIEQRQRQQRLLAAAAELRRRQNVQKQASNNIVQQQKQAKSKQAKTAQAKQDKSPSKSNASKSNRASPSNDSDEEQRTSRLAQEESMRVLATLATQGGQPGGVVARSALQDEEEEANDFNPVTQC